MIPSTTPRPRMAFANSFTKKYAIASNKSNYFSSWNVIYFRDHHHSSKDRNTDTSKPVVNGK